MKQVSVFAFFLLMVLNVVNGQEVIPLYKAAIPGAKAVPGNYIETNTTDVDGGQLLSKVTMPTLSVYLPANGKANGTAVLICPGGSYGVLAIEKEGYSVAKKLNELGITAFVLKYRLPSDLIMENKSTGPLQDALQAIYLVRKNAAVWGIRPDKIGVMGFSAGGHLAASLSVHYDDMKVQNEENISLRPDFSILIYPVISFGTVTHRGSVNNLLGQDPTQAQRNYFSTQNYVNATTPPTFLLHANDDSTVPVKNSILFNEALVKFKVPVEMHLYQSGGHGFGLKGTWFETMKNWMGENKLL